MFNNFFRWLEQLKELPALQRLMDDMFAAAERITGEGEAGGGLVRARANGRLGLTDLHIDEQLLRQPDRELLEELVLAACNQALDQVRAKVAQQGVENLCQVPGGFGNLFGQVQEETSDKPAGETTPPARSRRRDSHADNQP